MEKKKKNKIFFMKYCGLYYLEKVCMMFLKLESIWKKFFKLNEYYSLLTIFSMSYHVLFFSFIKKFVF